jgi:hypothetical protein
VSRLVPLQGSAYTCDWCARPAKWKKLIKGQEGGQWGGGVYMRSCDNFEHKSYLEAFPYRKKMGK